MFLSPSKLPARLMGGVALLSFAALAVALVAQHQFGVKPCPWCVLQRGLYLLVGAAAALGWAVAGLRRPAAALVLALCAAGVAAAVFQHQVAAQSASCAMGLADRLVNTLGLEELWPAVFMITANCADAAAYRLLGLGYEVWSGALFSGIAGVALRVLKNRR